MTKAEFYQKALKILLIPCIYNKKKATIKSCFSKIELTDDQYKLITDVIEEVGINYCDVNNPDNPIHLLDNNLKSLFSQILSLLTVDNYYKCLVYFTSEVTLSEAENKLLSILYQEE